jgi:hypothetical protein
VDKTRTDGVQFSVPCSTNIWDLGNLPSPVGHNYFGVLDQEVGGEHCGLPDPGTIRYAGAFALDARLGSFGTYTIGLMPGQFTYAQDDTAAMSIHNSALLPAIIHIP